MFIQPVTEGTHESIDEIKCIVRLWYFSHANGAVIDRSTSSPSYPGLAYFPKVSNKKSSHDS